MPTKQITLSADERRSIAEGLSALLADTYTLYLKTHNFHWNVTGPLFTTLHQMFEQQYTELATAVDEIAERIRALGEKAPGTFKQFQKLSSVEQEENLPNAVEMVASLVHAHEQVDQTAKRAHAIAQKAGDEVTVDLLVGRMNVHQKTAWMLRSMLEG